MKYMEFVLVAQLDTGLPGVTRRTFAKWQLASGNEECLPGVISTIYQGMTMRISQAFKMPANLKLQICPRLELP